MGLDFERCYRAVDSRDQRFDGRFYTAVASTGIYCRPSCPAATPKRGNVRFHPSAAAAQRAGFRACRRCRPDAAPGSPEWDQRGDVGGPDAFLPTDLAVRRGARALGLPDEPWSLDGYAARFRPWRSYAVVLLWTAHTVRKGPFQSFSDWKGPFLTPKRPAMTGGAA